MWKEDSFGLYNKIRNKRNGKDISCNEKAIFMNTEGGHEQAQKMLLNFDPEFNENGFQQVTFNDDQPEYNEDY